MLKSEMRTKKAARRWKLLYVLGQPTQLGGGERGLRRNIWGSGKQTGGLFQYKCPAALADWNLYIFFIFIFPWAA